MMGELILHIGMPKTGTTALQQFFFRNRRRLKAHGVDFPIFTRQAEAPQVQNGSFLNRYCQNLSKGKDPNSEVADLEANLKRLSECLGSGNRVLLSDELISLFSSRLPSATQTHTPYWPNMIRLLDEAGADKVTVVVYLRRQDDWVSSHWRQGVKTGHRSMALADFCASRIAQRSMNYAGLLAATEEAFGQKGRIVVRRYDRSSFRGGDIYRDFCTAAGIPWDDGYRIPPLEENASLTFDVAEAMRAFADAAPPKSSLRMDVLRPLALKLSREAPDSRGTTPFDEEATCALMEPYLEGNRQISERYLDGEPLFSGEYGGRPVWVPNEGRIAECRAAFEVAIKHHGSRPGGLARIRALARGLPAGIREPLRAASESLLGN